MIKRVYRYFFPANNPEVTEFFEDFGIFGECVLSAYHNVDPLNVAQYSEVEYCGYAKTFMINLFEGNPVYPSVAESFFKGQFHDNEVSVKDFIEISDRIYVALELQGYFPEIPIKAV